MKRYQSLGLFRRMVQLDHTLATIRLAGATIGTLGRLQFLLTDEQRLSLRVHGKKLCFHLPQERIIHQWVFDRRNQ